MARSRLDSLVMLCCLLVWILIYSSGIVIGTAGYREEINKPDISLSRIVQCGFVIVTCYTMTNIAILCCLVSAIGAICRNSGSNGLYHLFFAQGLFVYLILVSGLLLLGADYKADWSQAQYTRLAGTASLFSFLMGYSPSLFTKVVGKLEDLTKSESSSPMSILSGKKD